MFHTIYLFATSDDIGRIPYADGVDPNRPAYPCSLTLEPPCPLLIRFYISTGNVDPISALRNVRAGLWLFSQDRLYFTRLQKG